MLKVKIKKKLNSLDQYITQQKKKNMKHNFQNNLILKDEMKDKLNKKEED
jgi:hypothetical protein